MFVCSWAWVSRDLTPTEILSKFERLDTSKPDSPDAGAQGLLATPHPWVHYMQPQPWPRFQGSVMLCM